MGRVKTQMVRRLTFEVIKQAGQMGKVFDDNKKIVSEYIPTASKRIRNSVAGYATRLAKIKRD
mgnify:CR=1 FL=1